MMNPFSDPCCLVTIPHSFPREKIYLMVVPVNMQFSVEREKPEPNNHIVENLSMRNCNLCEDHRFGALAGSVAVVALKTTH